MLQAWLNAVRLHNSEARRGQAVESSLRVHHVRHLMVNQYVVPCRAAVRRRRRCCPSSTACTPSSDNSPPGWAFESAARSNSRLHATWLQLPLCCAITRRQVHLRLMTAGLRPVEPDDCSILFLLQVLLIPFCSTFTRTRCKTRRRWSARRRSRFTRRRCSSRTCFSTRPVAGRPAAAPAASRRPTRHQSGILK